MNDPGNILKEKVLLKERTKENCSREGLSDCIISWREVLLCIYTIFLCLPIISLQEMFLGNKCIMQITGYKGKNLPLYKVVSAMYIKRKEKKDMSFLLQIIYPSNK